MSSRAFVLTSLAVCLLLAGVLSGWASGSPDGLESVAATHGFEATAGESLTAGSPFADYPSGWSALVGCAVVGGLVLGVTRVTGGLRGGNTKWK